MGRVEETEYLVTFCILNEDEFPDSIKESEKCRWRCYKSQEIAERALKRYQEIYHQSLNLQVKPVQVIKGE
ncbi:MAG TPA: hypothetical protein DEP38_15305 [Cyanobacteria bacterium UBA9226]|nr:hypothetical protein [Cyanobacteria bacterium UBA9226]